MKIKDTVFKMHNNKPTEFIIVYIQKEESIFPYGTFGFDKSDKFGICLKENYETERKNSGVSRRDNPLPSISVVRRKEIFNTKEELLKSLI